MSTFRGQATLVVEKNFLHKNQKMWVKSPPKNVQVPADPRLLWHVSVAVLVGGRW